MRYPILVLVTTLAAGGTPHTEDAHLIRYRDLSSRMSLAVSQEIEVSSVGQVMAGRDFSFDLELGSGPAGAVTVTIETARVSYQAHGMKERLGVRHLTGRSFVLPIGDAGRSLGPPGEDAPMIDLGPMVGAGFSVAELLADTLPVLPEKAVSAGATWSTDRPVRSLEGWGYGGGRLTGRHRATAVDRDGARTIVTGESEEAARLSPPEGQAGFTGDLKRITRWTFDAASGRLLTLSMEQETEGVTSLHQGETEIRQRTRIELAPRGPEKEP